MKITQITLLVLIFWQTGIGQQLPSWSSYYETGFVWNPALTSKWNYGEVAMVHRQDWIGFDGAPQYTNISVQRPFISGYHTKSAMGVFVERDAVGPMEKVGGAITYNYRFRPKLFGKRDDVLGIGFGVNISRIQYNPQKTVAFSPDLLNLDISEMSSLINPNVNMGVFYISVSDFYAYQKSHYYAGLSVNQLVPGALATFVGRNDNSSLLSIQASPHATVHAGYRWIPFRRKYFYEPSLMIMYSPLRSVHAMAHVRYEAMRAFWLAGGIATTGEAFGQAGVILDKYSFLKKMVQNGSLRLGVKASWNVGSVRRLGTLGMELYGAYAFELE
jgi:type IX secretion system PorP/SprF family membrane protein